MILMYNIHPNVGGNGVYGMISRNLGVLKYVLLEIAVEMRKSMVRVLDTKLVESNVNNVADFFY